MTSNIFLQSIDDIKNSIKFSKIKICVAMIATDHKVFHNISSTLLVSKMKNRIVIDTRNVFNSEIASKADIGYTGIGHV